MLVQKIIDYKYNIMPSNNLRNGSTPQFGSFGLKLSQPIKQDVVTFKAKKIKSLDPEVRAFLARQQARRTRDARLLEEANTEPTKKSLSGDERIWGVSLETAKRASLKVKDFQEQVHEFMNTIFGDLLVSEANPKNLLLFMADRSKTGFSTWEKAATRQFDSMQEILDTESGMTDLNGAKTVMNYKTGKPESEKVLSRYIPLIKTGQVRLREIELQRPIAVKDMTAEQQEEFDYASKIFLDQLEDAQERVINGLEDDPDKIILINRPLPKYTKGNYCALHILMELVADASKPFNNALRWTRPFEHQHMGPRVAAGKPLDDKRFKFFDGKSIGGEEYDELKGPWQDLMAEENKAAKGEYIRYTGDANFQLRKDEIQEYKTQRLVNRGGKLYIPVTGYRLPPAYDLNTLYTKMLICDARAAKKANSEEKAKQAAAAAQAENAKPKKKKKRPVAKEKNPKTGKRREKEVSHTAKSVLTPEAIIKLRLKYGPDNVRFHKPKKKN